MFERVVDRYRQADIFPAWIWWIDAVWIECLAAMICPCIEILHTEQALEWSRKKQNNLDKTLLSVCSSLRTYFQQTSHKNWAANQNENDCPRHTLLVHSQKSVKLFFYVFANRKPRVTLTYFGFSPGAEHLDSIFKLITWFIDKTVAATNHGMPRNELMPIQMATMSKSKW